jgi:anti-sigma B factor antagonist
LLNTDPFSRANYLCFERAGNKLEFLWQYALTKGEYFRMPNPFSVQTDTTDGFAVIHLEGAVDAHTAPQFEEAVQSVIEAGQNKIVVDCEKMSYISSAGLGVFMGFIEEVREQDGDIKICGLSDKVKQPFEILGFESLYDFCPDVECAKKQFDQPVKGGI